MRIKKIEWKPFMLIKDRWDGEVCPGHCFGISKRDDKYYWLFQRGDNSLFGNGAIVTKCTTPEDTLEAAQNAAQSYFEHYVESIISQFIERE